MALLVLNNIGKSYLGIPLLAQVFMQVDPGEKIGLIGANGTGKTTLLRILAGREMPDQGEVNRSGRIKIGFLSQDPEFEQESSLYDEVIALFEPLKVLEREIEEVAREMAHSSQGKELTKLLGRHGALQEQYESLGGYLYEAKTRATLMGLGFSQDDFSRPIRSLSGGEKSRAALAKLLLGEPDLLLLDEPTNHLDIEATEWLEHVLLQYKGAMVVVSHDRYFLDKVVSKIAEIERGRVTLYPGNYSVSRKLREEQLALLKKQYEFQQREIVRQEEFIRRNIAGQKTKQAQSRRKMLERLERIERPPETTQRAHLAFSSPRPGSHNVLEITNLT
ncbi:MAG: ABC-F family ATP-binding cassette domain-containing protein, partial [Candidatus Tectomicrobia bacterium]|nr:ABC-F family ATP-binding cassette domain-containing protein [Candidatus Tectomicrobia bacterium]